MNRRLSTDESVTVGSEMMKVVVEAKVGLLFVIVRGEVFSIRTRGVEPLPI